MKGMTNAQPAPVDTSSLATKEELAGYEVLKPVSTSMEIYFDSELPIYNACNRVRWSIVPKDGGSIPAGTLEFRFGYTIIDNDHIIARTGENSIQVTAGNYAFGFIEEPSSAKSITKVVDCTFKDGSTIYATRDHIPFPVDYDNKVNKNQGTANAGKVLGIGSDGIVVPVDPPVRTGVDWSATATTDTDTTSMSPCFECQLNTAKPVVIDAGDGVLINSYAASYMNYKYDSRNYPAYVSQEDRNKLCQILGDGTYLIGLSTTETGSKRIFNFEQEFVVSNGTTTSSLKFLGGYKNTSYTVAIRSCYKISS